MGGKTNRAPGKLQFNRWNVGISDELAQLEALRSVGSLTEHEFQKAKQKILAADGGQTPGGTEAPSPEASHAYPYPHDPPATNAHRIPGQIFGIEEETWCTLMHLSQLLVFMGGIGIAVPIAMWAVSKDDSELARQHGDRIMNWLISSLIYGAIAGVLCFVLIGLPLLIILLCMDVVFPIVGAIKANQGTTWSYPTAIKFLRED